MRKVGNIVVKGVKVKEFNEVHTKVTELSTDVKWIRQTIEGNGVPGLISRVEENTKFVNLCLGDKDRPGLLEGLKKNTNFRVRYEAKRDITHWVLTIGLGVLLGAAGLAGIALQFSGI